MMAMRKDNGEIHHHQRNNPRRQHQTQDNEQLPARPKSIVQMMFQRF